LLHPKKKKGEEPDSRKPLSGNQLLKNDHRGGKKESLLFWTTRKNKTPKKKDATD